MNWTIYCIECVASIALFTCAIMIPLCRNPVWWIHDYPSDIQEQYFENHDRIPTETLSVQVMLKKGFALLLCVVVFVCCVVGFCGCIIGIVSLGLGGEVFKLGGVTIHSIIESHSHMSMPALYTAMAVGMVLCAAEAVLSKWDVPEQAYLDCMTAYLNRETDP